MTFRLRDGLSIGDQSVITYDGELIGNDFYYENTLPSVTPTLNLNFLTKKLDPRITFTRESTATYYDGKTTTLAEQNLLTNSSTFEGFTTSDVYGGSATQAVLTANYSVAPDGTTTAYRVQAACTGTTNNDYSVVQITGTPWSGYTGSIYIKSNTGSNQTVYFRFDTSSNVTSTVTATTSWTRVSMTSTSNTTYLTVGVRGSATGASSIDISVWCPQVEARSFAGAPLQTTGTPLTTYIPTLKTAAINEPRFDHDPVTGECKGLLIEEARTNQLTYSTTFSQGWNVSAATLTINAAVSPVGTVTATKLSETTATAISHWAYQPSSVTSGKNYTGSVYAKAGESRYLRLLFGTTGIWGGSNPLAVFDLLTGTIVSTLPITIGAYIEPVGNGWYRCSIVGACTTTSLGSLYISLMDSTGTIGVYDGNGYSGLYIWGAQVEEGSFPTSYIPTDATTVTRQYDNAFIDTPLMKPLYNLREGTLFAHAASFANSDVDNSSATITFGTTSSNFICAGISNIGSEYKIQPRYVVNSVEQTSNFHTGINSYFQDGTFYKSAIAYKENDFAFACSVNNTLVEDSSGSLHAESETTKLLLGSYYSSGNRLLNGHLKEVKYYPKRLTNAELQAITL